MFDLEIKNINEDFSVYKYSSENNVKYGLCIQSELEDLKNGNFPEEEYGFITKTDMEELAEYHLLEKDLDFDLEDYIYDNDKLFEYFNVLKEDRSFEKGYFVKVDSFTEIVDEYYNKLPVLFPVKVKNILKSTKYNLFRAKYLLERREDILIDYLEDEFERTVIKKENNYKYIDFYWFPNKKDWKQFKQKQTSSSYKETIKFLIEAILKIPLKLALPEEKRVEIDTDIRVMCQTTKIDETFALYQYTYKVNGELFTYSDICLVEELKDFQKNLILPSKITCRDDKPEDVDFEQYYIVKKEYLNKVKNETCDIPYYVENSDFVVSAEYFMNSVVDISFDKYAILKKYHNSLCLSYMDTRTNLPIMHPVKFEHHNSSPVNAANYDLNKIEEILNDMDNVSVVGKSDWFLDFTFIPTTEDWAKMCNYISNITELKCGMLLQHFWRNQEKEDFLQFILDEILELPKGGSDND